MTLPCFVMSGLGNTYVYFDGVTHDIDFQTIVPHISDIARNAKTDGVIFIKPSQDAHAEMEIFNKDASRAEMCGNGLRCVVQHVLTRCTEDPVAVIETGSGTMQGRRKDAHNITVHLHPKPRADATGTSIKALETTYEYIFVDVGNPHAVIAHDDLEGLDLRTVGPAIENNAEHFPNKVNVEFYHEVSPGIVKMRVWERGSGETQACGTGAAAVATVYHNANPEHSAITVELDGGPLFFRFDEQVWMEGPATYLYFAQVDLESGTLTQKDKP